jgi:hypothetical protein
VRKCVKVVWNYKEIKKLVRKKERERETKSESGKLER